MKNKHELAVQYAERYMEESGESCTVREVEKAYSKEYLKAYFRRASRVPEAHQMTSLVRVILIGLCFSLLWGRVGHAEMLGGYDVERLTNAIYHAEGGANTAWPYGILARYKTTTPRQACINTIKSKYRAYLLLEACGKAIKGGYLAYLASKYAPVGASNDPTGLNVNWLTNVRYFYQNSL